MAITVASLTAVLDLDKSGFDDGMKDVDQKTGKLSKVFGGLKKGVLGVTAAGAGLGVGIAAGVVGAVDASINLQKELAETERLIGDLGSDNALLAAKQDAEKLSRSFDVDVNETLASAGDLMDEFGLTADQSLDLIATGLSRGLNKSGDFLDSISEYSNQMSDAGFSAAQFFDLLEQGQKGGVLGTDKIADSIKELNIRLLEGSDDTQDALGKIFGSFDEEGKKIEGLSDAFNSVGDVMSSLRDGSASVEDVFQGITVALQGIEDPVERARIAVALFGTQAEDLGADVLAGLDIGVSGIEDFAGKVDETAQKFPSLGVFFADAMDNALLAMKPLTDELLRLANDYGPKITEFFEEAAPVIREWAAEFGPKLVDALKSIAKDLVKMGKAMGIINPEAEGMTAGVEALGAALNGITWVLEKVVWIFDRVAEAVEIASNLIDQFKTILNSIRTPTDLIKLLTVTRSAVSNEIYGIGKGLLGFAEGGIVPGPIGSPQLAMVHGGETIIPPRGPDAASATTIININGVNVSSGNGGDMDESLTLAFEMLRSRINEARQ